MSDANLNSWEKPIRLSGGYNFEMIDEKRNGMAVRTTYNDVTLHALEKNIGFFRLESLELEQLYRAYF